MFNENINAINIVQFIRQLFVRILKYGNIILQIYIVGIL
jgi:hypothetical protein